MASRDGTIFGARGSSSSSSSSSAASSSSSSSAASAHPSSKKRGGNRKTKGLKYKSLSILLDSMVGNEMRVELKNDTVLQGMLDEVNSNMDLTMFGVRCMRPGAEHAEDMEVMFVSGRMIKYVHIPDHIDIAASMRHHVSSGVVCVGSRSHSRSRRRSSC